MAGFALLSGYSQLYVGNHYFSDVLAGLVLGSLMGYISYQSVKSELAADGDLQKPKVSMKLVFPL